MGYYRYLYSTTTLTTTTMNTTCTMNNNSTMNTTTTMNTTSTMNTTTSTTTLLLPAAARARYEALRKLRRKTEKIYTNDCTTSATTAARARYVGW